MSITVMNNPFIQADRNAKSTPPKPWTSQAPAEGKGPPYLPDGVPRGHMDRSHNDPSVLEQTYILKDRASTEKLPSSSRQGDPLEREVYQSYRHIKDSSCSQHTPEHLAAGSRHLEQESATSRKARKSSSQQVEPKPSKPLPGSFDSASTGARLGGSNNFPKPTNKGITRLDTKSTPNLRMSPDMAVSTRWTSENIATRTEGMTWGSGNEYQSLVRREGHRNLTTSEPSLEPRLHPRGVDMSTPEKPVHKDRTTTALWAYHSLHKVRIDAHENHHDVGVPEAVHQIQQLRKIDKPEAQDGSLGREPDNTEPQLSFI